MIVLFGKFREGLTLGTDKIRQIEGKITDEDLAGTLGTKKEEITIDLINGKEVMIITYENEEQLEEATTRNPILKTLQCKKPNVNNSSRQNDWIKIRQWPTNGDIEQIIILNDMAGMVRKGFPAKKQSKTHNSSPEGTIGAGGKEIAKQGIHCQQWQVTSSSTGKLHNGGRRKKNSITGRDK